MSLSKFYLFLLLFTAVDTSRRKRFDEDLLKNSKEPVETLMSVCLSTFWLPSNRLIEYHLLPRLVSPLDTFPRSEDGKATDTPCTITDTPLW